MEKIEKTIETQKQIEKLPTRKQKTIESLSPKEIGEIEGLINAIEAAGVAEFIEYIRSPWRMVWPNFVAGIARGFGALLGVTLVIAGITWMLAITIDLPLIGKRLEPYVVKAQNEMNKYIEQTNYNDDFRNLNETLKAIEKNTTPKE